MRRIVIAGVASGVGKTTIACGLIAAFRRRGLSVQPFKVGPDYIDTSHHSQAAGRPSRNLDSVLLPPPALKALFARAANSVDLSIVEGVMGLFDGRNDRGEEGSTAQVAKLIDAPVLVVIDAAKTARSAAAVALGCARFDPELYVAGFVLNRVANDTHARIATEAIEAATGLPVLGALPRDAEIAIPERHLGLVPAHSGHAESEKLVRLADAVQAHIDLDEILKLANRAGPSIDGAESSVVSWDGFPTESKPRLARIALAQDQAFSFYYPDSLDLLEAWGGELIPFSPLHDRALPEGAQGVYLGGGFPELFADELAQNQSLHASLRQAAQFGLPIYAECGGLMYLGRTVTSFDGSEHSMVGLIPVDSRMRRDRVTVGYRTITARRSTPLLELGTHVVGHEFHYSELSDQINELAAAYQVTEPNQKLEGYSNGNILASYVHLHFGTHPAMAARFVTACAGSTPLSLPD
ncbi:MAG TPA: cobyrinate a,c-diamide synthase [Chloroflexota bacterium]